MAVSFASSIECLGRIFWRELRREFDCRQQIEFRTEPEPYLRIRWVPVRPGFHKSCLDFTGDPASCRIDPSVYIEGSAPVVLGDRVVLEEDVMLATSSHQLRRGQFVRGPIEGRPVIIEDDVVVGRGSIVCGGARLGKGCRIEPGSVVSSSIGAGKTAGGVPAKPHLAEHLRNVGLMPPYINLLGARTYLSLPCRIIETRLPDQITIGKDAFFNREFLIHGRARLRIGRRVLLAPRVEIDLSAPDAGECVIEDDCWIGTGARLIAPFLVRRQSIVAAGCHFTGTNKRSGLWGGRPAVLIHGDTASAHLVHL